MGSMHQRMVALGGMLLGVMACASGESSETHSGGAAPRDPATVAASPPLPGFSASDPAGRIPGSPSAPTGTGPAAPPAAPAGAGTGSPAATPAPGSGAPGGSTS